VEEGKQFIINILNIYKMLICTTSQMIDRVRRGYYNNFPSDDSVLSDNELLLHINDAVAAVAVKQTNDAFALTGIRMVPDGYITTYKLKSFTKDADTGYYYATLPHVPFGLAENSGINSCFFSGTKGQSRPILYVSGNEVDYFKNMATPPGAAFYWVEGSTLYLWVKTNLPPGAQVSVRMATHVTSNLDAPINVPPDAISLVYDLVMQKIITRKNIIQDNITDGIERS
jgi:hypothetical protein